MTTTRDHAAARRRARLLAAFAAAALLAACGGKAEEGGGRAEGAQHVMATATQAETPHAPDQHAAPAPADPHAGHDGHEAAPATPDTHAAPAPADPHAGHDGHEAALPAAELPGTSIYHLGGAFTGQDGAEFRLAELRGAPTVVVMFYGDCTTACPLLVKSAQDIEQALPTELAARTRFAMVSFDTERDTPDKLRAYAESLGLDKASWHWLVGSPLLTRQLATLLGVQYRDAGNGVFAHSNLVTVLDADGVPAARVEGLGVPLDGAVAAIRAALE